MTGKRKAGRPSRNDSRRNEILNKAADCFRLNGYNKTTLDQIGEALGFNKAALYYYFKDKEDLFSSVLKTGMLKLWEGLKAETNLEQGLQNKLLRYFDSKTTGWLVLLQINGISKENIINLNLNFAETIRFYRNEEIEFLKSVFMSEPTDYTETEIEEFICLLIDTQTDLTMKGLLLDDISSDEGNLMELKLLKRQFIIRILSSYYSGYPDREGIKLSA